MPVLQSGFHSLWYVLMCTKACDEKVVCERRLVYGAVTVDNTTKELENPDFDAINASQH